MLEDLEKLTQRVLEHPEGWPCWPLLPMKKRKKDGGFPDIGLIHANERLTIYMTNMFDVRNYEELKKKSHVDYKSSEDIIKDGWIVD